MHRAAFRNNVGVDFIFAENADFSGYDIVFVPPLYVADDALLQKISNYVKNGGHVIMSFKSGYCNEHNVVRSVTAPGPLRDAAGISYQEYSTIKEEYFANDSFNVGKAKNMAMVWAEYLVAETAKPLAYYSTPFLAKYPAVTENKFGKGSLIYQGCMVTDTIQNRIFLTKALETGVIKKENHIEYPISMKVGTNDQGKTIRYYFNYSGEERTVVHHYKAGINLISDRMVAKDEILILKPWDVVIVEEK
jgi:beta-galactosidase